MHTRNYLNLATIILIVIYINLLLSVPDYPDKPDKALQRAKTAQKIRRRGCNAVLPEPKMRPNQKKPPGTPPYFKRHC